MGRKLRSHYHFPAVEALYPPKLLAIHNLHKLKSATDLMNGILSSYISKYTSKRCHVAFISNILDVSCLNASI